MENRLSKIGRQAMYACLLFGACGVTTSCKDEYLLDDEKPSWLYSSIYKNLQDRGEFSQYLRLLADPDVNTNASSDNNRGLVEVLSKTGSKTVFVANDAAWDEFFKKNATLPESDPWHTATSYENLSASQKKLLIHTSMLNNAIVMENLASSEGDIIRGEYMRRNTDVATTDSITFVDMNSLPVNYNQSPETKDYWARFRGTFADGRPTDHKGIYLVCDSTPSMMVHFTGEHLTKHNISDEDFAIFMGRNRVTSDVHIYDALLQEKDGVCENGYVNVTEKVLTPLPNMAEVIRTNGETNIFSHILDRWSAPFYNRGITEAYKSIMEARGIEWTDSIFTKRYFSDMSWGHKVLHNDPKGEDFSKNDETNDQVYLKFDPGWNGYYGESRNGPEVDMAAMFVPNDDTMWEYFVDEKGGGKDLIETYYQKKGTDQEITYVKPTTYDELYHQIDQIPLSTLRSLLDMTMFNSFTSTVPSKMPDQRNDAMEQIFTPDDVNNIVKTKLANNGVVYIMSKVYGPADFTSVTAPAKISLTNQVMQWAIYNGSTKGADYMGLNYYAYLKAMQSRFAFFLPSDEAMLYYYDTSSFKSLKPRVISMFYGTKVPGTNTLEIPICYNTYEYDNKTGTIGKKWTSEKMVYQDVVNRLKDILESHTIVLDGIKDIDSDIDEYYVTKNGSGVKVTRGLDKYGNPVVIKVQGGYQLENEANGITGSIDEAGNKGAHPEVRGMQYNNVVGNPYYKDNGTTYVLDSPIISPSRSVYHILTDNGNPDYDPNYSEFYKLCNVAEYENIIHACGLVDDHHTASEQNIEIKKFRIFTSDNGPDYNVQFFNNYRYTIFVPTNDAINNAISNGLPTWEDISADYESLKVDLGDGNEEYVLTTADSLRLQAKITYLTNFIRYHFADNSVFVDKSEINDREMVTASFDNDKGLFCKIKINRHSGVLSVSDTNGGSWISIKDTDQHNVMARDITCSSSPTNKSTMNKITIDGSSFAVIHQIGNVLNHTAPVNGRLDNAWKTPAAARKYLKEFAIH